MKPAILFLFSAAAAFSQPFSAGVKVGLPLTNFIDTVNSGNLTSSSNTDRFIVGVTAELHLPLGLSIEGDVLYRRFNYQIVTSGSVDAATAALANSVHSNAWEFPLLLKYKFPSKIIRPYVDAGVAWDSLQGIKTSVSSQLKNNTTMGAVIGAGIEIKALVIKISPELRYIRWTDQHFDVGNILQSNRNQAEFLVGITF